MDGVGGLVRPGMDGVGGGRRLSWAEELQMRERESRVREGHKTEREREYSERGKQRRGKQRENRAGMRGSMKISGVS
jgi:hypothetical protein